MDGTAGNEVIVNVKRCFNQEVNYKYQRPEWIRYTKENKKKYLAIL